MKSPESNDFCDVLIADSSMIIKQIYRNDKVQNIVLKDLRFDAAGAELLGPDPADHLSMWLGISMHVTPLKQTQLFKLGAHS